MIDNKIFAGGKLNRDDDYHVLPKNDWVDARNVRINSTADGYLGAFSNIKGTVEMDSPTPIGDNDRVIGARGFDTINRIFYFTCDAIGEYHRIISYDSATDTATVLVENLTDTDNVNVLNFSNSYRINHIDLLDNRFLYWTDNFNPPRMIDITKDYGVITEQSLSVIKKPPLVPVTPPVVVNDPAGAFNSLQDNGYYFKYRFVYWDNAKSAYSPSSRVTNQRSRGNACISTGASKIYDSAIQFEFDGGGSLVKGVEIIAKANDDGDWQEVASIDFSQTTYGPIYRVATIDAPSYPNLSFTITVDGTPYVISASATTSANASQVNDLFDANFVSQGLTGVINKKYVEASNGEGYFEFWPVDSSVTFEITTAASLENYLNIFLVSDSWSNTKTDNLFTFVGLKNSLVTDQDEANTPFDYVPLLAGAQAMPNGNYLAYGNYTEGFDNVEDVDYDVLTERTSINRPELSVTITDIGSGDRRFQFDGTFVPGEDCFVSKKTINGSYKVSVSSLATEDLGAFISRVGQAFSYLEGVSNVVYDLANNRFSILGEIADNNQWEASILNANAAVLLKSNNEYYYGIQYKDDFGRVGAVNFLPNARFTAGFTGQPPDYSYTRPVINIKSLAPEWASKYSIVRTKALNASNYVEFTLDDGFLEVSDGTISIPLQPLLQYNNGYGANMNYSFTQGSRVIITNIFGTVQYYTTVKEVTDDDKLIVYQAGLNEQLLLSLNTVQVINNDVSISTQLFFEIGYIGDIVNREHQAISDGDTSQSGSTPATIKLNDGDSFGRNVLMDDQGTSFLVPQFLEFYSISDYDNNKLFQNLGNSNIINLSEQQTTYPATVKFSGAYVPGTQTNNVNRFLSTSLKDYSEMYGPIQKLDVDGDTLILGHKLRMAVVRIFETLLVDKASQELVGTSERLLSDASYYDYEAGIGDSPESYVRWGSTKYFVDKNRGLVCRLAKNGVTPISITAKMNSYFNSILPGAINVVGGFDPENQEYVITITKQGESDSVIFSENSNGFTSFIDILPTCYATLGQVLYSFELTNLYKMNASADYNTFYSNPAEPSTVTIVANDAPLIKKSFIAMSEVASELWSVPEIETDLGQESKLNSNRFATLEGEFHASFMRDSRVTPGIEFPLINGNRLKGKWIKMKLENSSTDFVYLLSVGVKSATSPQTGV